MLDTGKQTRKQTSKRQAKLGKVKPGYAGQRADVGGGAGGARTGGTGAESAVQDRNKVQEQGTGQGAGQYVAWGGKERHRGENRSLYIHNPPLSTWVTTFTRIYQYHDYQCHDSNRRF